MTEYIIERIIEELDICLFCFLNIKFIFIVGKLPETFKSQNKDRL